MSSNTKKYETVKSMAELGAENSWKFGYCQKYAVDQRNFNCMNKDARMDKISLGITNKDNKCYEALVSPRVISSKDITDKAQQGKDHKLNCNPANHPRRSITPLVRHPINTQHHESPPARRLRPPSRTITPLGRYPIFVNSSQSCLQGSKFASRSATPSGKHPVPTNDQDSFQLKTPRPASRSVTPLGRHQFNNYSKQPFTFPDDNRNLKSIPCNCLRKNYSTEQGKIFYDIHSRNCNVTLAGHDPNQLKVLQDRRPITLSFAGCGFLGIYHVGVAACLKKFAPEIMMNKIAGASAGALAGALLLCNADLSE